MVTIGEVREIPQDFVIQWTIQDSFYPAEVGKFYSSPMFSFANASWCLEIYPNGQRKALLQNGGIKNTDGYVDLYLCRKSSGPPVGLECSLGLKTTDKKVDLEISYTHVYDKRDSKHGNIQLLHRSELSKVMSEFRLPDALCVVCKLKYLKPTEVTSGAATAKCSYCEISLCAPEAISTHERNCMDRPMKCPTCGGTIVLKDWYDHGCHVTTVSQKLLRDFEAIMLNEDHSDTTVKVKSEEFRLHRCILAGRNPYFHSMFKNDMAEKNTGIVSIDDCEPDTFRSFVHFVYTGKVDKLTTENACNLYEIADRYQEDELKDGCLRFMVKEMSADSFCDFFRLALEHDERELFEKAVELFLSKAKEVTRSVKWQTFLREYPVEANELFIKTLDGYIK